MDTLASTVLPIPRLRLSRNAHLYETAGAGPSRSRFQDPQDPTPFNHHLEDNSDDYDDDQLPTPRITSTATLIGAETPAERLRAVLARVPTSVKSTPMPHSPVRTPSVLDSDFEPLEGHSATPSMARESLKAIFSRAIRDPGDTPQKESSRLKRRNSIDVSEVEASPRLDERARNKGKRRSLSDEEVEKPAQPSEASFRSSQAATFDILRERLTNSHTQIKDQHLPDSIYDQSIPNNNSHDTATILRDLYGSHSSPVAASTLQESLRMSANSQFQFESNLLEQDSEMQRAIEGLNSYEDSGPSQRPLSFPPLRTVIMQSHTREHLPTSPPVPLGTQSSSPKLRMHSLDKSHGSILPRQSGEEIRPSSRASSHSSLDHYRDGDSNQLREREREWNKPKTPVHPHTPDLKHQHSHGRFSRSNSPMIAAVSGGTLPRRNSITSMHSFDGDSSKGSSFGSQAEYRERINELERERNIEREREWNKRHITSSRSKSSMSLISSIGLERARTRSLNQVSRPELAEPNSSVSGPHRYHHHNYFSDSSRASSPVGSFKATYSDKEESGGEEVVHERERNWNAPRPRWSQHALVSPPVSSRSHSPTSNHVKDESLRTPGPKGEDPPVPSGKAASESASPRVNGQSDAKTTFPPRSQSPLLQERTLLGPKSSRNPGHLRSPLPLPSIKGKEKENDRPQTKSFSASAQPKVQTADLTSTPYSHLGYTFMRNRTTLPPIDFEKSPERSTTPYNKDLPSPEPTFSVPGSRPPRSVEQSHIPVRSPKKEIVSSTPWNESTSAHEGSSRATSRINESNSQSLVPPSFLNNQTTENQDTNDNSEGSDPLSLERTPTIRTVLPPPLETPEYTPPRSPSPLHQDTPINDENRLQKAIGSTRTTSTPINPNASSTTLQEISPPPSPPVDHPRTPQPPKQPSLSTPPRRSSFSASQVDFHTPSPPMGLPELPGPPSTSEGDEGQHEERAIIHDLHPDITTIKTPRPPGAWASTPGPQLHHELSFGGKPDEAETPARNFRSDFSTLKTPRAPGAWTSTPAPSYNEVPAQPHSYAGDTDSEYESGLATPVASLSRASSLPLPTQTPAPPGAWMATPGARKSVLKVRFNTHAQGTDQSFSNDAIESSSEFVDGITNASRHGEKNAAGALNKSGGLETLDHTPEPPSTPVSPSRSPRRASLRKSPSIRILDAFGREQVTEDTPNKGSGGSKNKSGIRVVDALGRNIENSGEKSTASEIDGKDSSPLKRSEALVRIRQGLSDLADGLDEINRGDHNTHVDYTRLRELNDESKNSRAMREQLSQTLSTAEADLRSKLEPLRASMKKNKLLAPAADRGLSGFWMSPWMFWGALFLQLLLILFMYRVSVMRARNTFLTTYYDPFYPDLHLHIFKPNTIQHSILSSRTPWLSIPDILRREGWKASTMQIRDNILIMISEWQILIWDVWGDKAVQTNVPWPPT